jgi:hypothetical protein
MNTDYEADMKKAQDIVTRLEWKAERGLLTPEEWYAGLSEAIDIQLHAKAWRDEVEARAKDYQEQQKDERPF